MSRPIDDPQWATNPDFSVGIGAGRPNKARPAAGVIGEGFVPQAPLPAEWINYWLNNHGQWINYLDSALGFAAFGDGSDGSATADGVTALAGCSLVGGVYKANRDLCFVDLTLNASQVLQMRGFRLYVSDTLTMGAGAVISCNGSSGAAGGSAGIVGAAGTGGSGGGIGGVGGNGSAVSAALGGVGGAGGAGAGGFVGGSAGALTAPTATQGAIHLMQSRLTGLLFGLGGVVAVNGGTGGGGGGGDATSTTGGAGGGPGGVLLISAKLLNLNATASLQAKGDVGNTTGGSAGGGGGGGGGAVILSYLSLVASSADPSTLINVSGGAGGAGGNASGSAGSAGHSYIFGLT